MNQFLKTRFEVDEATRFIKDKGWINHGLSCKDFDLRHIIPELDDGNILDMGANGSFILENAAKRKLEGVKIGIDLSFSEDTVKDGIHHMKGDLMSTGFEDGFFDYITVCSVIEHEVDYERLAKECSRLLLLGGKLFITCDYWEPKVNTDGFELYGLKWNILDRSDVERLIVVCKQYGLHITSEVDWTIQDAVINPKYCSPDNKSSYTFGIFEFEKQ